MRSIQRVVTLLTAGLCLAPPALSQPKVVTSKMSAPEKVSIAGLTLQQALAKPDATILVDLNGKQMTVGELRRIVKSRDTALAELKSGGGALRGGSVKVASKPGIALVKALAQQVAASAAAAQALRSGGTTRLTSQSAVAVLMQPGIHAVNGKGLDFIVSPGNPVTIQGRGFGVKKGQARLIGDFVGGSVALRVDDWHDEQVDTFFPLGVTGIWDRAATVEVVMSDGKTFKSGVGSFIAERADIVIPTFDVRRWMGFKASPNWAAEMRDNGMVEREADGDSITCAKPGQDTLMPTTQIPWGFVVTGVIVAFGRTDSGDGVGSNNDTPGSRSFFPGYSVGDWTDAGLPINWGVWRMHASPIFLMPHDPDICESTYTIQVVVTGPKGVPLPF